MGLLDRFLRRAPWLVDRHLTPGKAYNLLRLALACLSGRERVGALPAVLKIDISPACNLRCPVCVHADPADAPGLPAQSFKGKQMSIADFRRIVDEVKGTVSAVSLYYLGDPYMHPDVDRLCEIAAQARMAVHLSTSFSFSFSDERIDRILHSGVTHLTVCVDGFTQETYGRTRVGGRLQHVLSNLERLCQRRRERGLKFPKIEAQFIKFAHNEHEAERAFAWFRAVGVDRIESFWGMVNNYSDLDPGRHAVQRPRSAGWLPRCHFPFATMTIKWNGDAIPCCFFRHAAQNADGADSRVLGNVLRDGVRSVWSSDAYRRSRRLCARPDAVEVDPTLKEHFCHGCPTLYETDRRKHLRMAPQHLVQPRPADERRPAPREHGP